MYRKNCYSFYCALVLGYVLFSINIKATNAARFKYCIRSRNCSKRHENMVSYVVDDDVSDVEISYRRLMLCNH